MTEDQDNDISAAQRRKNRLHVIAAEIAGNIVVIGSGFQISNDLTVEALELDSRSTLADLIEEALADIPSSVRNNAMPGFIDGALIGLRTGDNDAPRVLLDSLLATQSPTGVAPSRSEIMNKTLDRLFAEAPVMEDATGKQAPALDCQIMLCNNHTAAGALSKTPEGGLRFMATGHGPKDRDGKPTVVVLEYFFDVSDLQTVVLLRAQVAAPQPTIFAG